ncbi:MAG: hypothetical protein K6F09_03610 [Clostridiales bacterium]|nr:hypothetical protein [Clostridiales bacterium]
MNKGIKRAIALVMAITVITMALYACKGKGEDDVDSTAIPVDVTELSQETVDTTAAEATDTTAPSEPEKPSDEELTAIVKEAIGDDAWDGDYASLSSAEKALIKKALSDKGFDAVVTDTGVTFMPSVAEENAMINEAVGEDWDGDFASLTEEQRQKITKKFVDNGYVVVVNDNGIQYITLGEAEEVPFVTAPPVENTTKAAKTTMTTTKRTPITLKDTSSSSAASKTTSTKASSKSKDVPTTLGISADTTKSGEKATVRRGIVPGTTAKNGLTTTTKAAATTAKSSDTATGTTANNSSSNGGSSSGGKSSGGSSGINLNPTGGAGSGNGSGSGNGTTSGGNNTTTTAKQETTKVVPTQHKPSTTYVDKYIKNILNSGSYTLKGTMTNEGISVNLTRYTSGTQSALSIESDEIAVLGKITLYNKNGKFLISFSALKQYAEIDKSELNDYQDIGDMEDSLQDMFTGIDTMGYGGYTSSNGMVCETYTDPDGGGQIKFYFNGSGLQRMISTDEYGNVVVDMKVTLVKGVTDKDAFTIPSSYKKTTIEEIRKKIESMVDA